MKKKIAIIYFSGTGNTQFVAELFKNSFFSYETELYRVEDIMNNKTVFNIGSFDMLGIGSPSIGFTPSKIIVDFCKKLPSIKNKKVFLFLTCAGPCYLNDTAFFDVKNNLKSKGYVIIYEKAICMPSNIFFKYDDEMLKRVFDAAVSKVKTMAINISNNLYRSRNDFMPYLFRWFFSIAEKIAILTVPLDFKITKKCTKCMICVNGCPRQNITLKKKITFGLKCEACYRCVYLCPQKAIKGRLYDFAILKEGYNIRKMFDTSKDIVVQNELKGIFKTMRNYFNSKE